MKKYDPTLVDAYIKHLVELSKQKRCYATEDVYNSFGVLLIKKGEEISQQQSESLDNHQLDKPVDEIIKLDDCLNERSLLSEFLGFFENNPHLLSLHTHNNFEKALEQLCNELSQQTIFFQKLTVLKHQLPDEYETSLFSAWFAALLAKKATFESSVISSAFTAGLFSNLGVLHIPEEAVNTKNQDPLAYQTHPIISSLIARSTKQHSKETLQAIMEHHERLYGEGYPHSKNIVTLTKSGLCLSVANLVYERASLLPYAQRYNLNIALPHMRIHNALNTNDIFKGALKAIAAGRLNPLWQTLDLEQNEYNQFLLDKTLTACELAASINLLNQDLATLPKNKTNVGILMRLQRSVALLHSTGLSSFDVIEMLCEEEEDNRMSLHEMIEMDLMQAEFFYASEFLHKQLSRLIEGDNLKEPLRSTCREQVAHIGKLFQDLPGETYFHHLITKEPSEEPYTKDQ